jgi:hypothetical protein
VGLTFAPLQGYVFKDNFTFVGFKVLTASWVVALCSFLVAHQLHGGNPEDGRIVFLLNVGIQPEDYKVQQFMNHNVNFTMRRRNPETLSSVQTLAFLHVISSCQRQKNLRMARRGSECARREGTGRQTDRQTAD